MDPLFPGVILSGGRSSRMGEAKALLPFGAGRLIDHVAARLAPQVESLAINSDDPDIGIPGLPRLADGFAGFPGPLAGIQAALAYCGSAQDAARRPSHVMILPVDAPFFPHDLVRRLADALTGPDDVALAGSLGRQHPVTGLWPLSCAARLADWLADPPTLKVRAFLDGMPVRTVEFPPLLTASGERDPFLNINTPEDLLLARRLLDTGAGD